MFLVKRENERKKKGREMQIAGEREKDRKCERENMRESEIYPGRKAIREKR